MPILISVLLSACFIPGILLRLAPFFTLIDKKKRIKLTIVHSLALISNIVISYFVITHFYDGISFYKGEIFFYGIFVTILNILVLRSRVKEHLFTGGLVMLLDHTINGIIIYVLNLVLKDIKAEDFLIAIISYMAVHLLAFWLLYRFVVKTVRPFLSIDSNNYWRGIWFVSVVMFFSCFFSLPTQMYIDNINALISRITQFVAIIAICRAMIKDSLAMKEKYEIEKELSLQQSHYCELANRIEETRRARHDLKHRLAIVNSYLDNKNYEGLRDYCNELENHSKVNVTIPYTGNPTVDGIMYHYATVAAENNIRFDYRKINPPEISNVDLCTLLGNALDNAVTACKTIDDNRFISVISNGEGQGMQLLIRNSFDGIVNKKKNKFISRKKEGDHGIGISSMQDICDRNNILMKIAYTDTTFDVLFIF